jgi:hypothetical protein
MIKINGLELRCTIGEGSLKNAEAGFGLLAEDRVWEVLI